MSFQLLIQLWAQHDITEYLNSIEEVEYSVTQQTISNDLKAVQKEWLKSFLIDFDQAKAADLARIDERERVAWEGWERSC